MPQWYEIDNAQDIPSPTLLLYPDRIRANIQRMIRWVPSGDVARLRPHVKTHKLPQVIQMKLDAGITKFKTSTIAEAEMTAQAGGCDIMIAYQQVGPNVRRFAELIERFPECRFSTIADNASTIESFSNEASERGLEIALFIDLNIGMNRTGIAPGDEAIELVKKIQASPGTCFAGLHAYDGHIHDVDAALVRQQIQAAFQSVWSMRDSLIAQSIAVPAIVGCGTVSSRFQAMDSEIEVSAGTSILWDAGQPLRTPPMEIENAAVLLARVISRPADGLLCIDLGHKAIASEMQPPRVKFLEIDDATHVMHSEEHLVIQTKHADDFPVGSVLYAIPSHICPTVALQSEVWAVRDRIAVERWPVVARTRRISI